MASHDLSNTKTTVLGATLGVIPGIEGQTQMKDFHAFSERYFKKWGGPRAPDACKRLRVVHDADISPQQREQPSMRICRSISCALKVLFVCLTFHMRGRDLHRFALQSPALHALSLDR